MPMTIKTAANRHSGSVSVNGSKKGVCLVSQVCISEVALKNETQGKDWNRLPAEEKIHRISTVIFPVRIHKKLLLPFSADLK